MPDSSSKTKYEAGTNLIVWNIDPDLKAVFKATCALEKRTIRDVITELMIEYTNRKR